MKTFRVKQTHLLEKNAWAFVEASNKQEAITKARTLQWEEFEQRETVDQTQWKIDNQERPVSLFEKFLSIFTGKY